MAGIWAVLCCDICRLISKACLSALMFQLGLAQNELKNSNDTPRHFIAAIQWYLNWDVYVDCDQFQPQYTKVLDVYIHIVFVTLCEC